MSYCSLYVYQYVHHPQLHSFPTRRSSDLIPTGQGGHGGGDALMLHEIFVGPGDDALGRASDHLDGLRAISVGVSGNISLETGQAVDIAQTMGVPLRARHDSEIGRAHV